MENREHNDELIEENKKLREEISALKLEIELLKKQTDNTNLSRNLLWRAVQDPAYRYDGWEKDAEALGIDLH